MRTAYVAVIATVLVATWGLAAHGQGSAFDLEPGTRVLAPVTYKQLSIFPVVRGTIPVDKTQYLTLAEGLKKGLVAVSENAGGATVNRVSVENRSDRPLLLLGGEIILGGQQDRVLGKDAIVPARDKATLEVFCVEHGRWSGRREFTAAGGMADTKVRGKAKFAADQQGVWDEVAKKTSALKATSSTGTYRTVSAGQKGEEAIKPFREQIGAKLKDLPQMVGVVAAVNGRVTSVELFATPELFANYRDKLLDGIYLSAADVPVVTSVPPSPDKVKAFMDDVEAQEETVVIDGKAGKTLQKRGAKAAGTTVAPAASPKKPVYKSYQALE